MVEIESTSDPVRLSFLQSILSGAAIRSFVFQSSVGAILPAAIPTRLMVSEADEPAARQAINAADPREVWR